MSDNREQACDLVGESERDVFFESSALGLRIEVKETKVVLWGGKRNKQPFIPSPPKKKNLTPEINLSRKRDVSMFQLVIDALKLLDLP